MTTRPMKTLTLPVNGENVTYTFEPEADSITTSQIQDGAITEPKINQSLWDKLLVSEEASGNPASFDDGADDVPVSSLAVALNPIQNLNGYDSPWIGGSGKNLLPTGSFTISGGGTTTATFASDGIHINGTKAQSQWADYLVTHESITLKANTSYTFTLQVSNTSVAWSATLRNGNTQLYEVIANNGSGTLTITPTADVTFDRWRLTIRSNDALAVNSVVKPMLRLSSTTATYAPYENICPIYPANGRNLFDESLFDTYVTTLTYQSYAIPNGVYIMSSNFPLVNSTTNVFFLAGQVTSGVATVYNGVYANRLITVTVTDGYYTVAYRSTYVNNPNNPKDYQFQIERGSSVSTYAPYQGISVLRAGKNLLSNNTVYKGGNLYRIGANSDSQYPFALKAGTYTMSNAGTAAYLYWRKEGTTENNVIHNNSTTVGTFTLTDDANYRFWFYATGDDNNFTDIQLELGNIATSYEPYTSASYPYTLGREVYGGSVDLATGVLTVTWGTITLDGSETWQGTPSTGWYTNLYSLKKYKSNYVGAIYADKLVTGREQGAISGYYDNSDAYPNQNWLYYYRNTFTTVSEVKSYFQTNPTQIVYELATPQTYQLTPTQVKTLLGYNNISSTGTVDVIYHADTKLYVDKMTAVDNNIIAPTEADFVATRNYTMNDLVIVNDTLYKVTANIASGSAITPNSNVQQTTLGALIKALS